MKNIFNTIEEAIEDIAQGKMIIVVDDEDRENEGDLVMAAGKITPKAVNFMTVFGRGLICTPITQERAERLELFPMVEHNNSRYETAFTVSVDSIYGGSGISCRDRSRTILAMADKNTSPEELSRPGHVFPLIAKKGGVLRRAGHTEAAVDLVKLAGPDPTAVICEIMDADGNMAKIDELAKMAKHHNLKLINIKDLIRYRREKEVYQKRPMVWESINIDFPNRYGNFQLHMFESEASSRLPHIALVKGEIKREEPILVRVHSECFTGDIFGSLRCDCGDQLAASMQLIDREGCGVFLYMRQEGRGIGLSNKIKAYRLQDRGDDTVTANRKLGFKADLREYGIGAQILYLLGVRKIRLLTNNPKKIIGIEGFGLEVVERCPIEMKANSVNKKYLKTKKDKLGHLLSDFH